MFFFVVNGEVYFTAFFILHISRQWHYSLMKTIEWSFFFFQKGRRMHHFSIACERFIRGTILRLFFGTTILHNSSSWSGLPFAFWIEKGGRCDPFSLHQTGVTEYAFLCVPVVQGNFRMPPVWEMLWNGQRRFVHSGSCGCVSASDKSTTITLLILLSKKSHYIFTMGSQAISLWPSPIYIGFLQRPSSSTIQGYVSKNNHYIDPDNDHILSLFFVPPWLLLWTSASLF